MIYANSITLDETKINLEVDGFWYVYATLTPSNANCDDIEWYSANESIAIVSNHLGDHACIYAKGEGSTTIYARSKHNHNVKDSVSVVVKNTVLVRDIDINNPPLLLEIGRTHKLTVNILPNNADDQTIHWKSSNSFFATVDSDGLVKAHNTGMVTIYACARDGSGVQGCCTILVGSFSSYPLLNKNYPIVKGSLFSDPIDLYSGAHTLSNTLLSLLGGQELKLEAKYDSTKLTLGSMGKGWHHNFEKRLERTECELLIYDSPSSFSTFVYQDDKGGYVCTTPGKSNYVLTVPGTDLSGNSVFVLNCNGDGIEHYNDNGDLTKIVNHQGFETVISRDNNITTITDTLSNDSIYLEKDSNGKIVKIYDDAENEVVLTYTGDMLTTIRDVRNNTLTYTYNEDGQVLTGKDSKNTVYFTNTYDEFGRVIRQKDGITGSTASTICYCENTRITTDRNGKTTTREFDDNGLLISVTDENGYTKSYEYDENYNVTKETDANGNSVIKEYNSFNKPTVVTDKNGNRTVYSYDANGNVTRITYPAVDGVSAVEEFEYNSRNQLIRKTDIRGTVTEYTYDANGMPKSKKIGAKNPIVYNYENGRLISQTDARGYTTQYGYNVNGQLVSQTDANNNVTYYEYDASGNLTKSTDSLGKTVINTYDCNNQKTSVTDANGNVTEYTYNCNMKNTQIKLPDNNIIKYEYDGEDRVKKVIDQANKATVMNYDNCGRLISKQFADGSIVKYFYDAVGNVIREDNPKNAIILKTYDANGNLLTVTDSDGNVTRNQYNALGKLIRSVNSVSGATVYEYSLAGDLLSETDALGNKKTYTYDAYGNRLTATDAKGNTTAYTYDSDNNLLTVTDALNNTTAYTYNALNQLVSVKDAKNNTVTYGYDALGRRTTITDAKGNIFTTQYDGNGNVIKTLDAKGNTVSETTYNSLNLPAMVVDSMGKTTTYTYNALGKVASITNGMNYRSEYGYDAVGRNTSVRDANNNQSSVQFDTMGNITRLAGPLGGATNYTYDQMGRLIAETTASGGTVTYGYNELSVKEQLTNARGQVRKFFYNSKGQIAGYVGVEDSVSYTYDANGNVLTVTDKNGTVSREYDALNRVTKYTDTFGKVIQYEYDAVGNLVRLIYPDNTAVNYTYDANNNLLTVTDWASRVTSYTYDVNNRVIGMVKPDGSITTTVYDNKQRITSTVEKTANNVVITGFEYTYDAVSRIIEEKHLANNTKICYTYDSLDRVTKRTVYNECDEVVSEENYTYDAAGNITDAPNSCFQYDTNNRLTVFNGYTLDYDLDGNLLCDGTKAYEYDSANRLIKAGGHAYTYNAEDVRIRNLCSEYDTTYTYNTNCKLSQLLMKTTNGIVTKYVYGKGLIGEQKCDEVFKTYHFDYRGSTVAITDQSGNITDTFKYDTYGNLVSRTGSSFVIFQYNGRDGVVTDKNGLIYMRARYYSPAMRRFVNADIIPGEISNAVTLNRYAYANGNPVSNVDPFGLDAQLDEYINENYSGVKNISLVINSPNIDSRDAANIKDGKLNNGHSFIRLDNGDGNVQYVGFAPVENSITDMILGNNVEGKFVDDSKTDWNVAKVYKLSDKQYSYISDYIDSLDDYKWNYNIETYNCTTFAVNTVRLQGAAAGNFMTVREHDWTLPSDMEKQLKEYKALPKWIPAKVAAWLIKVTMGGFHGYTPADAAQDLMKAEGTVLLKEDGAIETITNKTYIRGK